jgi:hypothetical protein
VANDRDEIAVPPRLHPDNAEAVLGVLVGDALNQPSKHLPVGWLWLRLHDMDRTRPAADALAVRRSDEVCRPVGPLSAASTASDR